ncbi:hypothetical protein ASPWEDRAFT_69371 [Aspergillus wentii DTO 134E9]|uniref:Heterokaryon incompatibility domain-containing protein n=1 Tax=Aspergillus wentii DTO 134E9 TaxID=1073089 RepID=A0A1L9RMK6_ASPWE|nr:uncharacterized protein ASPWEDRAFT_69371 [Aspergillus wentii DTO 134E9]OJJ36166.1 hypothetical protein ASPWEDRAFT_69371 [Aspergillus wentii DTO 134E9]
MAVYVDYQKNIRQATTLCQRCKVLEFDDKTELNNLDNQQLFMLLMQLIPSHRKAQGAHGKGLEKGPRETETTYLPTRLIDVGDSKGNEDPRLVVTKTHPLSQDTQNGDKRYLALIYCWGPPEEAQHQLTTTRDTLQDRLRDGEDWEMESARMADVYSRAHITICAMQGNSCLTGFLQRAVPPSVEIPFQSSLDPSISGQFSVYVRNSSLRVDCDVWFSTRDAPPPDPWEFTSQWDDILAEDLDDCVWNTRGWTFQELKLSLRTLLFGRRMMHLYADSFLESEDRRCVDYYNVWGPSLEYAQYGTPPELEEIMPAAHWQAFEALCPLRDWQILVDSFSRRSLTEPSDALPAMSAIAQCFAGGNNGDFLAGVWSAHLHRELLWAHYSGPSETRLDFADNFTAPSWSWARQNYPVEWTPIDGSSLKTGIPALGRTYKNWSESIWPGSGWPHRIICESMQTSYDEPESAAWIPRTVVSIRATISRFAVHRVSEV